MAIGHQHLVIKHPTTSFFERVNDKLFANTPASSFKDRIFEAIEGIQQPLYDLEIPLKEYSPVSVAVANI